MHEFSLKLAVTWIVVFFLAIPAALTSDDAPDMYGNIALKGRFASAHACAVSPNWALTAGHVLDPRPFNKEVALLAYRFEAYGGESGLAMPQSIYTSSDLGWLRLNVPVARYYKMATERPEIDDKVYFVVYKLKRNVFHQPKLRDAKIVNISAGHIFTKGDDPEPGSSGGCLLNRAGELIGIVTSRYTGNSGNFVGGHVGVYGKWSPEIPEEKDASKEE
jgi:hypothetical protein